MIYKTKTRLFGFLFCVRGRCHVKKTKLAGKMKFFLLEIEKLAEKQF